MTNVVTGQNLSPVSGKSEAASKFSSMCESPYKLGEFVWNQDSSAGE